MLLCGGGTVGSLHTALLRPGGAAWIALGSADVGPMRLTGHRKVLDSPTVAACTLRASRTACRTIDGLLMLADARCGLRAATGAAAARQMLSCMVACDTLRSMSVRGPSPIQLIVPSIHPVASRKALEEGMSATCA